MSDQDNDSPRIKKLEVNDETVQELSDAETTELKGGMRPRGGGCGDDSSFLSTCTKINTGTVVPTTETC